MNPSLLARTFLLCTAGVGLLPAQTVQLPPVADATTDQSQPTANFGADPELNFGKVFTSTSSSVHFLRGHVQFDLTAFQGLVPQRATLFWYQSRSSAAGCLDVSAHRILAPWSEATVTWSTQPAHDAATAATACVGNSFDLGWKQFDLTALVQAWTSGAQPNHGVVIRDPRESTAGASRPGYGHSRESTVVALRPYLELEFAAAFGAGCGLGAPVPGLSFAGGSPRPGGSFTIATQGLAAGSLGALVLGTSDTTWGSVPLPLSLASFGFPGCDLLVAADAFLVRGASTPPSFDVVLNVPNDPNLASLVLYVQTAGLAAATFQLANGLRIALF